jgi:NitT/TauT family transport system substrate-binding protein
MKKRIISVLLVTAMVMVMLLGCGSDKADDSQKEVNVTEDDNKNAGTGSGTESGTGSGTESGIKTGTEDGTGSGSGSTLTPVMLNEVAHSIFYAPMYVAIEEGYFEEEGIDLTVQTGFGADKTMTAVISGNADIGFMGSEASIYTYNEGATDYVVNFAQLTQRAGNFLVAREEMPDFTWEDLIGKDVLGGRKGVVHISM